MPVVRCETCNKMVSGPGSPEQVAERHNGVAHHAEPTPPSESSAPSTPSTPPHSQGASGATPPSDFARSVKDVVAGLFAVVLWVGAIVFIVGVLIWTAGNNDAPPPTTGPPAPRAPVFVEECGFTDVDRFDEGYVIAYGTAKNPLTDATVDIHVGFDGVTESDGSSKYWHIETLYDVEPNATVGWSWRTDEIADYRERTKKFCGSDVIASYSDVREITNPGADRDD
jgi:hypothetical protein